MSFFIKEDKKIEEKKFLTPIFAGKNADNVEFFFSDIYGRFSLYREYIARLQDVRAEIQRNGFFTPTENEIRVALEKIFKDHNLPYINLQVVDQRQASHPFSEILKHHTSLAGNSTSNIILIFLPNKIEIDNSHSIITIKLTEYCELKAVVFAPNEIRIPNRLEYVPSHESFKSLPVAGLNWIKPKALSSLLSAINFLRQPLKLLTKWEKKYRDFQIPVPNIGAFYYVHHDSSNDVLDLQREIAHYGPLMQQVPVIGIWTKRSAQDEIHLQNLIVATRQLFFDHLFTEERLQSLPDLVQQKGLLMVDKLLI